MLLLIRISTQDKHPLDCVECIANHQPGVGFEHSCSRSLINRVVRSGSFLILEGLHGEPVGLVKGREIFVRAFLPAVEWYTISLHVPRLDVPGPTRRPEGALLGKHGSACRSLPIILSHLPFARSQRSRAVSVVSPP